MGRVDTIAIRSIFVSSVVSLRQMALDAVYLRGVVEMAVMRCLGSVHAHVRSLSGSRKPHGCPRRQPTMLGVFHNEYADE